MNTAQLSQLGNTFEDWKFFKETNPRPLDGEYIAGVHSKGYIQEVDAVMYSLGRFYLNDVEIYRAWGIRDEEHCSFNSIRNAKGLFTDPVSGCPDVRIEKENDEEGSIVLKSPTETISYKVTFLKN